MDTSCHIRAYNSYGNDIHSGLIWDNICSLVLSCFALNIMLPTVTTILLTLLLCYETAGLTMFIKKLNIFINIYSHISDSWNINITAAIT